MRCVSNIEFIAAAAAAKPLQSCPTLCDPVDGSLPGFSVHGILQARTLEWVAISFSIDTSRTTEFAESHGPRSKRASNIGFACYACLHEC